MVDPSLPAFITSRNSPQLVPWLGEVAKVGCDEALVRDLFEVGFRVAWALRKDGR